MPNSVSSHLLLEELITPLAHVATAKSDLTVKQAKEHLFSETQSIRSFEYMYVLSATEKLEGMVNIKTLLQAPNHTIVSELIIAKPSPSGSLNTSLEKAAYRAIKNGLTELPIIDSHKKLIGVLPTAVILKTIHKELSKDLYQQSGIILEEHEHGAFTASTSHPIHRSMKARSPWIIAGLFGGIAIAQVINHFEGILAHDLIYVSFIPLIVYVANAIGVQSQTLYIREQSHTSSLNTLVFLIRQLIECSLLGIVILTLMVSMSATFWNSISLGFVVGIAMLLSALIATFQAVLIPYGLSKLKQDPAAGSGPFATLLQDFTSVGIYLMVISLFVAL
jgi:magnesium transporter